MCCLFGIIDYGGSFSGRQKDKILSILAIECEARGVDATGIAYNSKGHLAVYKRPQPAHKLRFHIPGDAVAVMGHTRLTTQGSETKNFNNHPFFGTAGTLRFALAHNGVLYNDKTLRRVLKLPKTNIETDSYIAVQLLERQKALDFSTLKSMAEQVEGSFTFTVLDQEDNLYFVKGDSPLCIYHFPKAGVYLYASTEAILQKAWKKTRLSLGVRTELTPDCGEILKIDRRGELTQSTFEFKFGYDYGYRWFSRLYAPPVQGAGIRYQSEFERMYLQDLKTAAASFGYSPEYIDNILRQGFTLDEVEQWLYCGEL